MKTKRSYVRAPRVTVAAVATALAACTAPTPAVLPLTPQSDASAAAPAERPRPRNERTEAAPLASDAGPSAATPPRSPAAGVDGAGAPPDGIAVCRTLTKQACLTCCAIAYADLEAQFKQMLGRCFCDDPGECAAACGDNQCAGRAPTDACESCMSSSQSCGPAVSTLCSSSPDCAALLDCYDACDTTG